MRRQLWILLTSLLLVMLILASCLNNQPASSDSLGGEGTADARTGETYNWRMITTWAQGTVQFEQDKKFVETVNTLSQGRLNVTLHQVGELAEATQVLDTVSNGTVEMGGDWPNYWSGKNTAFDLLGSHVVGFNGWDYLIWIYQAGGLDLYHEIYGKYNTVYFPIAASGMESGIRSNVPVESLDDLGGMNIRFVGLIQSRLLQEFGGNPVAIAAHEIYEALQRGVVDGAEYSSPWADKTVNMEEVTQYWATPGWHQTSAVYGVAINKDAWETLPDDLKSVIETAAKATMMDAVTQYAWEDALAANQFIDEDGIQVTSYPDEDIERVEAAVKSILEELAEENPDFKKILESQQEYMQNLAKYRELQGQWSFGANYGSLLDK